MISFISWFSAIIIKDLAIYLNIETLLIEKKRPKFDLLLE